MLRWALAIAVGLAALMALTGCTTGSKDLYYWGYYEESLYDMYLEPGKTSLTDEILRLEVQIEKATAAGMMVPPGLHAHVGYLYATEGDYATAMVHFQAERTLFPESTVFIDGLIERMKE